MRTTFESFPNIAQIKVQYEMLCNRDLQMGARRKSLSKKYMDLVGHREPFVRITPKK